MYANLRVTIKKKGKGGRPRTRYAHTVVVTENEVVVGIDKNDGDGSYAIEGPEERYPRKDVVVRIDADF